MTKSELNDFIEREIKKWREDRAYIPIFPEPISVEELRSIRGFEEFEESMYKEFEKSEKDKE